MATFVIVRAMSYPTPNPDLSTADVLDHPRAAPAGTRVVQPARGGRGWARWPFVFPAILFALLMGSSAVLPWTVLQIDPGRHLLVQALSNSAYGIALDVGGAAAEIHADGLSEPADTLDDDLILPAAIVLMQQLMAHSRLHIPQHSSPTLASQPDFPPPKLYPATS